MALERKVKWFFILIVAANVVVVLMVILGALKPASITPAPDSSATTNGTNVIIRTNTH
jgi:hypothetical protein